MTSKPTEHPPYRVASRLGGVQFAISCRQPKVMAYRSAASSSCCRLPRTRISSRASHDERSRARVLDHVARDAPRGNVRARATSMESLARARSRRARLRLGFARRGIRASRRDVVLILHLAERRGRSRLGRAALAVAIRGERRCDAPQRRRRRAPLRGRRAGRARRAPLLVVSRVDDRGGTPQRISGGDRPPPERGGRAPRRRGRRPRGVRSKPTRGDGGGHSTPPGHARGAGSHPMGRRASLRRVAHPAPPRNPRRDPPRHPLAARRRVHPVRHLHARPAPLILSARRGRQGPLGGVSARAGSGGTSTRFERRRTRIDGSSTTPAGASIRATSSWVATRREDTSRSGSCASSRPRAGAGWDPTERRRARVASRCPPGWC